MKKKKVIGVIGVLLIFTMLVVACAKKDSRSEYDSSTSYGTEYKAFSNASTADYDRYVVSGETADEQEARETTDEKASGEGLNGTSAISGQEGEVKTQDKIIRTFYLDVETQEFDSLITNINAEIKRLNGYVESSRINGKGYYDFGGSRFASIVARIPSDRVDEFVGTVNGNANVITQQETSENVSLQYIEAESRLETLRIEQERLYAILEKEIELENIITLERRLSDIRYELENYESKLRYYDNQVAYSTVTLSINEVEKFTQVPETKQTLGDRIAAGWSDTMYNISESIQNFIVWFVVNLPYIIFWGIIIILIFIIGRRFYNKYKDYNPTLPVSSMDASSGKAENASNQKENSEKQ